MASVYVTNFVNFVTEYTEFHSASNRNEYET